MRSNKFYFGAFAAFVLFCLFFFYFFGVARAQSRNYPQLSDYQLAHYGGNIEQAGNELAHDYDYVAYTNYLAYYDPDAEYDGYLADYVGNTEYQAAHGDYIAYSGYLAYYDAYVESNPGQDV